MLKKLLALFKALFPSRLPEGMTEFDTWAKSVINLAGAPDNDSIRFALATMILHADQNAAYKPKMFFILRLKKGMSNQVAAGVMEDLKAKQKAEMEAAAKAASQTPVATVTPIKTVDEQPKQ